MRCLQRLPPTRRNKVFVQVSEVTVSAPVQKRKKKKKKHTLVDQSRNFPELPCLFLFHHSVAPQCFHIGSSLCSDTDVSCQHCVPEQGTWDKHASSPPKRLCLQLSGPHIFRARFRKNQVLLQAVQSSECINPLNLVPKEDVLHTGGVRFRLMADLRICSSGMAQSAVVCRGLVGQMPVGDSTDMQMA